MGTYATFRESGSRCPSVPCHLRPPLRATWSIRVGLLPNSPVIGGGRVHVMVEDGEGQALDERTGQAVWSRAQRGSPVALADAEVLYFGALLDVRETATGNLLRNLGDPGSDVALHGDVVVVRGGDLGVGRLHAAAYASGELLWRVRLGGLDEGSPHQFEGVFGLADESVVVGRDDGAIVAYALADGRVQWRVDVTAIWPYTGERKGRVRGAVVIWDGLAIFEVWPWGAMAVSVATGDVAWRWNGCVPLETYLYDGRLYVLSQEGNMFVIDAKSGGELASAELRRDLSRPAAKASGGRLIEPLLVSHTHVWVGSEYGAIVAFDRETLEYAWCGKPERAGSTHYFGNSFVCANGRLYWGDVTSFLHCFEEVKPTDPVLRAQRSALKGPSRASRKPATA